MELTLPIFEEVLIYMGHFACIGASLYMIKVGHLKLGLMFLLGFILQIQGGILSDFLSSNADEQGACWAAVGSFYECLPLGYRISIHLSQIGTIILGVAIYISAKKLTRNRA